MKNVFFISLGCDKNLVDSEKMLAVLQKADYTIVDDEYEAEIIIINTCCFIGDAKEESIQSILEMALLKETGKCQLLLVTGCLAQRYQDEITKELPEVDGMLGISSYPHIVQLIEAFSLPKTDAHISRFDDLEELPSLTKRTLTTGGHYAYLKIAEGCNKHCTYCVIPSVRGNYRSVPMEKLILEANELVENGVRELILVAQETSMYGIDCYGKKTLPALLEQLSLIKGLYRIRIMYCYPEEINEELIMAIKTLPKVCHYLDIPIQNANNDILKRMGRHTTKEEISELIKRLREEIPDIVLRTTLITGFPGESEEAFEENLAFVREMKFERLGVFSYSPEEGTPAASFIDQIDEETKEYRKNEIMLLQQEIVFEKMQTYIGTIVDVMIEGFIPDGGVFVGRTYMDAPNVDGLIFIQSDEPFMSGDFIKAEIIGVNEYDFVGEYLP